MATVSKNFRIKDGLIVEGTTGTINGENILTTASTTTQLDEGSNLYYTNERVDDRVANLVNGGTGITITYDDAGNALGISAAFSEFTTDQITEGEDNLFFTEARAIAAVGGSATSENTPNTVVKRDGNGDFIAQSIALEGSLTTPLIDASQELDITAADSVNITAQTDIVFTSNTGAVKVGSDIVVSETAVQTLENKVLGSTTSLGANLDADANRIINLAAPMASSDAATKEYVDAISQGLRVEESTDVATAETLAASSGGTVTYDNGTSGVGATLTTTGAYSTIDGISLTVGNRVLVKNESNAAHNGIYVVTSTTVLTRAEDYDSDDEISGGDFVFVTGGDTLNSTGWVQTDQVDILGTDMIVWTQFSGAGTYTAGIGLDLLGTQFSVDLSELSTSDLPEGASNKYYTDTRVYTKVKTAIESGIQENISFTFDDENETISVSAENGVSQSTTDDLEEGEANLYFTDARAVSAIQSVTPYFNQGVMISGSKQLVWATTGDLGDNVVAFGFPAQGTYPYYRSAKLLVKVSTATHTELSEVLMTLDSSNNIAITEYGVVGTNGSLSTISASFGTQATDYAELVVTPAQDGTEIMVFGTVIV